MNMINFVTPFYAGLMVLFQVALSWHVVRLRNKYQIRMGDGGHTELTGATRVHSNLLEYLPSAMLMLLLLEIQGFSGWVIHVMAIAFIAARLMHLKGIHDPAGASRSRKLGTRITWAQMTVSALLCVLSSLGVIF